MVAIRDRGTEKSRLGSYHGPDFLGLRLCKGRQMVLFDDVEGIFNRDEVFLKRECPKAEGFGADIFGR